MAGLAAGSTQSRMTLSRLGHPIDRSITAGGAGKTCPGSHHNVDLSQLRVAGMKYSQPTKADASRLDLDACS